jgi:hypothetical protein
LEKSDVRIYIDKLDILSIVLDNSKVYFSSAVANNSFINMVNLSGKNRSIITANSLAVDTFQLALQHSEATLTVAAKMLSGTLSDSSKLITLQTQEISMRKDSTSRITFK